MNGDVAVLRILVEALVWVDVSEVLRFERFRSLSELTSVIGSSAYRWQIVNELPQLFVQSFYLFKSSGFVQLVEQVGDFGHNLGEPLSQDDECRCRRFVERFGDKRLTRHHFRELQVHGFFRVAICVDNGRRSTQDQRITVREGVS